MPRNYEGARWGHDFSRDIVGEPRDDPSLDQITEHLRRLEGEHPDKVSVEVVGQSVGGSDLFLVSVTDRAVPDDDKQIPLFLGAEHGNEHSATTALLRVLDWLVTPEAEDVRRRQKVLLMPCVNPDGYDTWRQSNVNGVNLYADYSLTEPPTQPESRAVWEVMERFAPEVVGACHGHWRRVRTAAFENCQGSYGTSRFDRTHSRLFAEEVNRACDEAGYPQDRMEEDAERILSPLPGHEGHNFRSGDGITPGVYAYNRFHSLLFSMEIMNEESGLVKIRKILELGNQAWRYEPAPGYPVRVVCPPEPFAVAAYGQTAAERRESRLELWRSNDAITRFTLPGTEDSGFLGIGLTVVPEDRQLRCEFVSQVLDALAGDPNIAVGPLREALGYRLNAWWAMYFDPPAAQPVPLPEIRHGVSLRARLLPGSRVRRVLVNGREASPSGREGYQVWTPRHSYTFVQINLPPGRGLAAPDGRLRRAVCTIEYEPGRVGRL